MSLNPDDKSVKAAAVDGAVLAKEFARIMESIDHLPNRKCIIVDEPRPYSDKALKEIIDSVEPHVFRNIPLPRKD